MPLRPRHVSRHRSSFLAKGQAHVFGLAVEVERVIPPLAPHARVLGAPEGRAQVAMEPSVDPHLGRRLRKKSERVGKDKRQWENREGRNEHRGRTMFYEVKTA